jgi:hypothetical protein
MRVIQRLLSDVKARASTRSTKRLFFVSAVALVAALYFWGAFLHSENVNTRMSKSDQSAYMEYAQKTKESNYADVGGRNRMPIYPILLSIFYDEEISDEVFFERGKTFNIVLSFIVIVILAQIFLRYLSKPYALSLLLILTFTIFIFKAAFVQAEILYYFFHFLTFLLLIRLIRQPSIQLSILTGIAIAIAQLTKSAALPMLVLGLFFLMAQQFVKSLELGKNEGNRGAREMGKSMIPAIINVGLVLFFFLITMFPYIQNSKERFGHYFYNVNSTFYLWYDSWEEATQGTKAFGDRVAWPNMPVDEIPSLQKYLKEHSSIDISQRIISGMTKLWNTASESYGYFKYGIAYLLTFVLLISSQKKQAKNMFLEHIGISLFVFCYIVVYWLSSSWVVPVAGIGDRLILAHFIPLMFSLSYVFSHAQNWFDPLKARRLEILTIVVFIILPVDIYLILTDRILVVYGGK